MPRTTADILAQTQQYKQLHIGMEISNSPRHQNENTCIFQALLEQCSEPGSDAQVYEEERGMVTAASFSKEHCEQDTNEWLWSEARFEELPFQGAEEEEALEDVFFQIRRVQQLRLEQEDKISLFFSAHHRFSENEIECQPDSPLNKTRGSLSPRKTKKIDKSKALKLT